MSTAKKLIRGLKDVSPFFTSHPAEDKKDFHQVSSLPPVETKQPEAVIQLTREIEAGVSCYTILPHHSFEKFLSNPTMLNALRKIYHEVYVLSSLSQKISNGLVQEQTLTSFQVEDLLHPEFVRWSEKDTVATNKHQCFFLNPSLLLKHRNLFQMLDRVILHASASSTESMAQAYQMLGACLQENPQTRFFLFITDVQSDDALEMVCERFAAITSRFMGCEIDFLGYQNGNEININEEILHGVRAFDEVVKDPLKMRLAQMFSSESVLEIK